MSIAKIVRNDSKNYPGYIDDVLQYGCISGAVGSLCYYKDTVKFYNDHTEEIWNLLEDCADQQGISIMEFMSSLNGAADIGSEDQFKNLLSWFAYEETCARMQHLTS